MINQETKFKLQAYLDNELSGAEARKVAAWLDRDAEGRALSAELSEIKTLLAGNELPKTLPESREFYWSRIERAIRQQEAGQEEPRDSLSGYSWWVRLVAPAMGVVVLLVAGLSLVRLNHRPTQVSYMYEIESPLENTGAISFHSQSAGMTVVWVESRGY
jgi:anti-sigma factor RsiW